MPAGATAIHEMERVGDAFAEKLILLAAKRGTVLAIFTVKPGRTVDRPGQYLTSLPASSCDSSSSSWMLTATGVVMALPLMGCWHRSSYSTEFEDACVEAAQAAAGGVLVRDTKDHSRCPVAVSSPAWTTFLGALGEGM